MQEKRIAQGDGEDRWMTAVGTLFAVCVVSYLVITVIAMVVNQIAVSSFNAIYAESLNYYELAQLWYSKHTIMPYPGEFSSFFAPACGLIGCLIEMLAATIAFLVYQTAKSIKSKMH